MFEYLIRIAGQRSLVKVLNWRERRLVTQQHVEDFESPDMPAEDYQAERQRGGQDKPDRAPYPAPEDRGNDNGKRRNAGAMAI
ncbi:hypothetical protein D3C72_1781970 [compost metagenome]